MQQPWLFKECSGELVLVERLHMGRRVLALKRHKEKKLTCLVEWSESAKLAAGYFLWVRLSDNQTTVCADWSTVARVSHGVHHSLDTSQPHGAQRVNFVLSPLWSEPCVAHVSWFCWCLLLCETFMYIRYSVRQQKLCGGEAPCEVLMPLGCWSDNAFLQATSEACSPVGQSWILGLGFKSPWRFGRMDLDALVFIWHLWSGLGLNQSSHAHSLRKIIFSI